jgi:hypothetical protein
MEPFDTLAVVLDVAFIISLLIGYAYVFQGWRTPHNDQRRPYADTEPE